MFLMNRLGATVARCLGEMLDMALDVSRHYAPSVRRVVDALDAWAEERSATTVFRFDPDDLIWSHDAEAARPAPATEAELADMSRRLSEAEAEIRRVESYLPCSAEALCDLWLGALELRAAIAEGRALHPGARASLARERAAVEEELLAIEERLPCSVEHVVCLYSRRVEILREVRRAAILDAQGV